MPLEIKKAVRRALPLQIAFYGPTGSGKTLSALLFASGLASGGKVTVVDTERGRASLYADNKRVLTALPQGFDVIELDEPYHPQRYIEAVDLAESKGCRVLLIDSGSDSWDGPGGCSDIAEKAKNMWNGAKLWNKRMMTRTGLSDMHVIWCLKAQEKTKIIDKAKTASGKQEYLDLGVLPIWEKNNFYPMLLGFSVDPKTHLSTAVKYHDDLGNIFREPKLITKADGEAVRLWNEGGAPLETGEQLQKRSAAIAARGMKEYAAFFESLPPAQRKLIAPVHSANKIAAEKADTEASLAEPKETSDPEPGDIMAEQRRVQAEKLAKLPNHTEFPDALDFEIGALVKVNGKIYATNLDRTGWNEYKLPQES